MSQVLRTQLVLSLWNGGGVCVCEGCPTPRKLEPMLFVVELQLQRYQGESANLHPPFPWKGQVRLGNLEGGEVMRQRSCPWKQDS